jgi:hypothetical protein
MAASRAAIDHVTVGRMPSAPHALGLRLDRACIDTLVALTSQGQEQDD